MRTLRSAGRPRPPGTGPAGVHWARDWGNPFLAKLYRALLFTGTLPSLLFKVHTQTTHFKEGKKTSVVTASIMFHAMILTASIM